MSGTRGGGGAGEKEEEEEWQEQAWAKVGGHEREIKTWRVNKLMSFNCGYEEWNQVLV